jgi:site-specific recombinase XerD
MGMEPHPYVSYQPQERRAARRHATADPAEENKTVTVPRPRPRLPMEPRQLDAGPLGADIGSFRLHLAAEGKTARTVQSYTSAVRWFAAGYLIGQAGKTSWEQVDAQDIQQWIIQLLGQYSGAYASIQFRALRQFFKWRAAEDESPDPMARLRAPKVTVTAVPVFTSVELSELGKACQGRSFAERRDAAIIAVFTATGIRLSELAGIRYHPDDPARSDLDLHAREIRITGKGGKPRTVRIGHQAARSLDRYLRARARHPQAWRPQLWLGASSRGPLTPTGIYQIIARRGRQCGVTAYPHRFRHHFSHTWLDRGGAERDLMELNGWTSPQMLTRYGASARGARTRRSYDRIMDDST